MKKRRKLSLNYHQISTNMHLISSAAFTLHGTLPLGVSVRLEGLGMMSVDFDVAGMLWFILL